MSNAPIDENSGKAYWQIADQIPTVHHWPESDRAPVDDSLPRHAFDIRRGVQLRFWHRLGDLLERGVLLPVGRLLLRYYENRQRRIDRRE
ncbi:MAG: hypothetical protein Q8O38_10005 [Sulfurimicrobium sp.]|nr:hypothetical protein [Sulfurimicrobium sp.]